MEKIARGLLALAFSLTCAVPAHAGIADSPLPVLQAGTTTLFLYSVPGVVVGGDLGAYFSCTSTDTTAMTVGVEVFSSGGGGPVNDATATAVNLASGATVIFGTGPSAEYGVDQTLGIGDLPHGSARILSTSKKLICTAWVADRFNTPPQTSWQLPIIAKLKQKAAN